MWEERLAAKEVFLCNATLLTWHGSRLELSFVRSAQLNAHIRNANQSRAVSQAIIRNITNM